MKLQEILDQLETVTELAGKIVVGMPERLENIGSAPYAWITNIVQTGGQSPILGPVREKIELRVEITIGARTLGEMLAVREKLTAALLNFQPDPSYDPIRFRIGRMEFTDPGWVLWRDEFVTGYELR